MPAVDGTGLRPLDSLPEARTSGEPLVVWRTWLIAAEPRPSGNPVPLLTGLLGFPWRGPELDAKCTIQDHTASSPLAHRRLVDRHHVLIPDPDCTCGIYATRTSLDSPPSGLIPRGRPIATGFVELSGHILQTPEVFRAQHATIVGPLHISAGRLPLLSALAQHAGTHPVPRTVATDRSSYAVRWMPGGPGFPYETWRRDAAHQLTHRYGVPVVGLD